MSKEEAIEMEGTVVDVAGGGHFRVDVGNDHFVVCRLSGKLWKNKIRVVLGDAVKVEVSPYDPNRGRITYRNK